MVCLFYLFIPYGECPFCVNFKWVFFFVGSVVLEKRDPRNYYIVGCIVFCAFCRRVIGYVDEEDMVHSKDVRLLKYGPVEISIGGVNRVEYFTRISDDVSNKREWCFLNASQVFSVVFQWWYFVYEDVLRVEFIGFPSNLIVFWVDDFLLYTDLFIILQK